MVSPHKVFEAQFTINHSNAVSTTTIYLHIKAPPQESDPGTALFYWSQAPAALSSKECPSNRSLRQRGGGVCQAPVSLVPHIFSLQSPQARYANFHYCQDTLALPDGWLVSCVNCCRCLSLLGNLATICSFRSSNFYRAVPSSRAGVNIRWIRPFIGIPNCQKEMVRRAMQVECQANLRTRGTCWAEAKTLRALKIPTESLTIPLRDSWQTGMHPQIMI